jgi:hypothetical protein
VSDGIRTRDRWDHNPELYQLSYAHQASTEFSDGQERAAIAGCAALDPLRPAQALLILTPLEAGPRQLSIERSAA